ncbi:MAG: thiamine pyrophosphate-dependent dehydrogenase E1 component subunit alpha [Acidobacteriaceae bacterium]|nr:thiamine pyrophosphate-dependent dehydrogenase E1 component subunit alpha [Acidobacteriaceae bacterium]
MMHRIRISEERIADLVTAGEIKTPCHFYIGQEAVAAGVCLALQKNDYVWTAHRSHGHYLAKGGNLASMLAEIYGKRTGCSKGRGGSMHLLAAEVGILGTVPLLSATIPLAVGAGLASKLRHDGRVSVSFFGDGATAEGHFHESLNLAAIYKLPVIFVCENNLYQCHMHIQEYLSEGDIYKSGDAHGIPGIVVDGNDVIAVHKAALEAVRRARAGEGPTLLECKTFRWRGHVGPSTDIDVGIRRRDDVCEWLPKDPIPPVMKRLLDLGATEADFDRIAEETLAELDQAVEYSRRSPYPAKHELLEHVFYSGAQSRAEGMTFPVAN